MTSKEKVWQAVNHCSGNIPLDFGGTSVTGIHCSIVEGLRAYYGLERQPVKIIEPMQMLGEIDPELKRCMGVDTTALWGPYNIYGFKNENWKPWRTPWGQDVLVPGSFHVTSGGGNTYMYAGGDTSYPPSARMPETGYFFDTIARQGDIDDDNLNPEDNTEEFTPISDEVLDYYRHRAKEPINQEAFVLGNIGGIAIGDIALVPAPMLKAPKGIRDVAEWYMSTAIRQGYLHQVFEKQTDMAIRNLQRVYDAVGDLFDAMFVCGTDFGTQIGTFCSPETYKALYHPYYTIINNWIHTHTKWKTFKHSCGAVESFYPLFIESGFDIVNPVQWTAAGMERKGLKEKYGRDLVFWGGGVDTQQTLPFGSAEDVKKQVRETCEILGRDGGFVFNAIHNVQAQTPVKNVVAMVEAVHAFNREG